MEQLLDLVITGGVSGALYSLIATSVVLSYAASGIFNLAYGGIAFSSAFLYYELTTGGHLPVGVAAFLTIAVFGPCLGWLLNRVIFRRLGGAPAEAKIMATVGLLVALPAIGPWMVEQIDSLFGITLPSGENVYVLPELGPSPATVWHLPLGAAINSNQLIVFGATALVGVSLWLLLRHTRLGLVMRAYVDRPALATYRGVNGSRTTSSAWMLSSAIAALAGVIGAPILNSLQVSAYNTAFFVAITAAVLAGFRSIPKAFIFGLLIGIAQDVVFTYAHFAASIEGFNASVPFVLLLGGLLWIGRGRGRVAGSASDAMPPPDPGSDLPPWRRTAPWAVATVGLLVYQLFIADAYWQGLVANGLAVSIVFLSFTIVTGLGGMVSLAQGAFVTSAGLTTGFLLAHGVPAVPSVLLGVLTAVVLGAICAVPALRVDGLSLALATLALGFLGDNVLFSWSSYTNSTSGWTIPRITFGSVGLASNRVLAVFLLGVIMVVVVLIKNLRRSANGRAMLALRSSEAASVTVGVPSRRTKLTIFALSAAIAGIGGLLVASFSQSATGASAPTQVGLLWFATVVLFGVRRPGGAVLAGLSVVLTPQIWQLFTIFGWHGLQSTYFPAILFGLGAVTMAQNPDGMLAVVGIQQAGRRARRRRAAVSKLSTGQELRIPKSVPDEHRGVVAGAAMVDVQGASGPPALAVSGLRAGYDEVEVIHGIDVCLVPSQVTAMLGANGAGKSTLCATLAGGLDPTTGSIVLDGEAIEGLPAYPRAARGLVLAPESRGIFPGLSVEENLKLWLRSADEVAAAILLFPILGQRRSTLAGQLSGGEQQILTLAPLLVRPPRVLICDEPTLGLAPLVIRQVLSIVRQLGDEGTAVLMVEEKVRGLLEVVDNVALLRLGEVVWSGPATAMDEAALTSAYLGVVGKPNPAGSGRD